MVYRGRRMQRHGGLIGPEYPHKCQDFTRISTRVKRWPPLPGFAT